MKNRLLYLIFVGVTLLMGCSKDDVSSNGVEGNYTFVAQIENAANNRTAVDANNQVVWTDNDQIGVFGDDGTLNSAFTYNGTSAADAIFTGSLNDGERPLHAYYPYQQDATLTGNRLTFTLPSEFDYTPNSNAPMIGVRQDNDAFLFKHLCGLLKFTLTDIPEDATRLVITSVGEDAPYISGQVEVKDIKANDAILEMIDGLGKTVTVNLANITDSICTFHIPLPVNNYDSLSVSIENDNEIFIRKTLTDFEIKRATILSIDTVNVSIENKYLQIEKAKEKIDPLFVKYESITELSNHLEEIKKTEFVADAWVTKTALYIETRGGDTMFWLYTPQEEVQDNNVKEQSPQSAEMVALANTYKSGIENTHTFFDKSKKVCIINQQANDESRNFFIPKYQKLCDSFKEAKFQVDMINGEFFDVDFFFSSLTKYNIIFLVTHGSYNPEGNFHAIFTGEEYSKEKKEKYLEKWKGYSCCYGTVEEKRNGKKDTPVTYFCITEKDVPHISGNFNNTIIFNTACESLMETDAFGQAFLGKDAKIYMGYDETNGIGKTAGPEFYLNMLKGMTIRQAFKSLPQNYKIDRGANLRALPNENQQYCIVHPEIKTNEATNIEASSATLNATITGWNSTLDAEKSEVGFIYGIDQNNMSQNIKAEYVSEPTINNSTAMNASGDKKISVTLSDLDDDTKYYYRAYLVVAGNRYYGDVRDFTKYSVSTGEATNVGTTSATCSGVVELPDENETCNYGICYSEYNSNPTINNSNVVRASGGENFSVTLSDLDDDTKYYYRAYLVVAGNRYYGDVRSFTTTKKKEHPTPGDAIDLGLPSGTLWASRNVGATSPSDYGDYFAWGETSPKSDYDWDTYKWDNSDRGIIKYNTDSFYGIVDNNKILDPSDDAATANWGSEWRMPTKEEMEELYDKCTWKFQELNDVGGHLVVGPNGNSIFLPYAGSHENSISYIGGSCQCWSSSLDPDKPYAAYYLNFQISYNDHFSRINSGSRKYGRSVRPVRR